MAQREHYLYRHVRLDTNEVFYIGIGTKFPNRKFRTMYTEYSRAYNKEHRTVHWKRIVNKTEILIEIVIESNDYDFIKQKEIEFIKLYGRLDLKTGTLINLTDGGDGAINRIITEEEYIKRKLGGKKHKVGIENKLSKKVFVCCKDGLFLQDFFSIKEACRILDVNNSNASKVLLGKKSFAKFYRFFYTFQGNAIEPLSKYCGQGSHGMRKVQQIKDNIILNTFDSIIQASRHIGAASNTISRACRTGGKAKTFNWKYVN